MLILSSISIGLEFWSVNHTSIYKNFELNAFKNIKYLGKISSNWPNNLLGPCTRNVRMKCVHQDPRILLIIVVDNITMD